MRTPDASASRVLWCNFFFFLSTNFYYRYTISTGTIMVAAATGAAAVGQWEELETQHVLSQK